MESDDQARFGQNRGFRTRLPLRFPLLPPDDAMAWCLADGYGPVELIVPDLDSFDVPEEDLERIQRAIDAALDRD